MIYFRTVSLALGIYMLLAGLWIWAAPVQYQKFALRWIPEKRPAVFPLAAGIMLAWVLYTWTRYASYGHPLSLAVCLVLSLSLIKGYFAVFRYAVFRDYAESFLSLSVPLIRTFALLLAAMGILFSAIGLALT